MQQRLVGVFIGTGVGMLFALLALFPPDLAERAEQQTYDLRLRWVAGQRPPSPEIVIVHIAEADLQNAEAELHITWPWPRELFGALVDYAREGGAKVVLLDWVFPDAGTRGMQDSERFAETLAHSGRAVIGASFPSGETRPPAVRAHKLWGVFLGRFALDDDARRAGLTLLAWNARVFVRGHEPTDVFFGGWPTSEDAEEKLSVLSEQAELDELLGASARPIVELGDDVVAAELSAKTLMATRDSLSVDNADTLTAPARELDPPLHILAAAARRVGNVVQIPDSDGILRRHRFVVAHDGGLFPSLPLAGYLVAHADARLRAEAHALFVGDRRVPLADDGQAVIRYRKGKYLDKNAYDVLASVQSVAEGKRPRVSPEIFRDKYVVISASAQGMRDVRATPIANAHLGAVINANVLDNLITGDFVRKSSRWLDALGTLFLALAMGALVGAIWDRLRSGGWAFFGTAATALVLVGGYLALTTYVLGKSGLWLAYAVPASGGMVTMVGAVLSASARERRSRRFVQEALGRYTSPALVKQLVAHPEYLSLGGERREMSVYFSDIASFTSFSERLPPERLVALLNDYLTHMTDIVLAHDGVVDKYIGDALMAFWGAPLPDEKHAGKAARAALAMQRECAMMRHQWRSEYGSDLVARAGINSGPAVIGNMGSKHKYNYTVMGDMVNLASRLEGANKAYGTTLMVSQATYDAVSDEVVARELDLLTVKGKQEPVRVYELLAQKGQLEPARAATVARFGDGLALYRRQEFVTAREQFRAALTADPEDGPSAVYVQRCTYFVDHPPGADWDGVWRLKEK